MGKFISSLLLLFVCNQSVAIFIGIDETCRREGTPEPFVNLDQERANRLYWWLHASVIFAEGANDLNGNQACFSYDLDALRRTNPFPELMNYAQAGCVSGIANVLNRQPSAIRYQRQQRTQAGFCSYLNEELNSLNERVGLNFQDYILSNDPQETVVDEQGKTAPPLSSE